MTKLRARKRCRTSEHENSAKSPGTNQGQIVVLRRRKAECDVEFKPKKARIESPSQSRKCAPLDGQNVVPRKRKADWEIDQVKPKKAKIENSSQSWKSAYLEGQNVVPRQRKADWEIDQVKPKKARIENSSQSWKCGHLEGQNVVPRQRKAGEAEVKPNKVKVENPSQTWKSPPLEGQVVSKKGKAELKSKKAKVDRKSSPEDELYDVTYQVSTSRADFQYKYLELEELGSGGFGSVFAGIRLQDGYRVAIKHIPRKKVLYKKVVQNGVEYSLIDEVALMVKVARGSCPAVVCLLDCYKFPDEIVIVMERPYPALSLRLYQDSKGGLLKEDEAKMILKQMVEASIQMHNSGVFHRDLKLENILVELGHMFPKVRVIDFGCGCLVKEGTYDDYSGTFIKAPPEWYFSNKYRAEPTTVYQLGTLLYELLHYKCFATLHYLKGKRKFDMGLSKECLSFLKSCLDRDPGSRPSFEELQRHPWFF